MCCGCNELSLNGTPNDVGFHLGLYESRLDTLKPKALKIVQSKKGWLSRLHSQSVIVKDSEVARARRTSQKLRESGAIKKMSSLYLPHHSIPTSL